MTEDKSPTDCRVCGGREVLARLHPIEMMFGMREPFTYFRCASCGCLQLQNVPDNLGRYYPENYYSFHPDPDPPPTLKSTLKRRLLAPIMTRQTLGRKSLIGSVLCKLLRPPPIPPWLRLLPVPIPFNTSILDVGCGSGMSLLALRNCGFTNLLGVDPFIARPLSYHGGVRVEKSYLNRIHGKFSLIMFHHVFEHLEDPLSELMEARKRLNENGQILIRIPLSDSAAAEKYQEKWVQLDAPRHITLQTRNSMEHLARKASLKITGVIYDSTEFQFWGSEQYLRDIPLFSSESHAQNPLKSIFTPDQIKNFAEQASRLNQEQTGDQAAFILELD